MVRRYFSFDEWWANLSRFSIADGMLVRLVTSKHAIQSANNDDTIVEFSIHGIVGIRFVNPSPKDIEAIVRPLRLTEENLSDKPDITVIFKKDFETSALNSLGRHSIAYDTRHFYVLDKAEGAIQARIPFDTIGYGCEVLYQSDIGSAPLLSDIICLIFLRKGYVHLHASAFLYNNNGILVTGWSNGGKSDTLLSFANHGALYVGDELVMLSSDGSEMYGVPIDVTIWDWQFKYVAKLMPKAGNGRLITHKIIRALDAIYGALATRKIGRLLPLSLLKKALPTLREQLKVWVSPDVLFEKAMSKCRATPRKLFLIMSHNSPDVVITPCQASDIARRMAPSNDFERMHIYRFYKAFCFLFPDSRNEFIDGLDEQQGALIKAALHGLEAYEIYHPHGLSFETLYQEMRPYCD